MIVDMQLGILVLMRRKSLKPFWFSNADVQPFEDIPTSDASSLVHTLDRRNNQAPLLYFAFPIS